MYLSTSQCSCVDFSSCKIIFDTSGAGRCCWLSSRNNQYNVFHRKKSRHWRLAQEHTFRFLKTHQGWDSPQHNKYLIGSHIRATWLVSRANVSSLREIMIDLSRRTNDPPRYCTNNGSNSSNLYRTEKLEKIKTLEDINKNRHWSPGAPILFLQKQKLFPIMLKWGDPVSFGMYKNSASMKHTKHKQARCGKTSSKVQFFSQKWNLKDETKNFGCPKSI